MTDDQVRTLATEGIYKGRALHGSVTETHISYVVLSSPFAFKIKKPVVFSFLDFSTLSKRKKYCDREVMLNKRFSPIYYDVVPIRRRADRYYLGGKAGDVIDYAVRMKKLMASKKMDVMLKKNSVTSDHIRALAVELANFHQKAEVIHASFDEKSMRAVFNDIAGVADSIGRYLGRERKREVTDIIQWSDNFIHTHVSCLQQRIQNGFIRDLHGDLHSGNIFLYKKPVLFDCIEFNDSFRQIDVLSEIAFLCMDLEVFGKRQLSREVIRRYTKLFPCITSQADRDLLVYYKCHRANVRAKIHALGAVQEEHVDEALFADHLSSVTLYLDLMKEYRHALS